MKCLACGGPLWSTRIHPTAPKEWRHTMTADNDHDPKVK